MKLTLSAVSILAAAALGCGSTTSPTGATAAAAGNLDQARALLAAGDADGALLQTDAILAANPRVRDAHLLAADANLALLASGRSHASMFLADAIRHLERARDIDPEDSQTWIKLAGAHLKNSDFDAGIEAGAKALEIRTEAKSPELERAEALLAIADNQLQIFVDVRRQEIAAEARRPEAATMQAAKRVLATYENAVRLGGIERGTIGLARVHQWLDREGEALAIIERGIVSAPGAHGLHTLFREIYTRTGGSHETVKAAYRRMLRERDGDPALLFYLGRAEFAAADARRDRSQWAAAIEDYDAAAATFAQCGKLERAYRLNCARNEGLCRMSVGRSQFELGELDAATDSLFAAFEACSELAEFETADRPKLYHPTNGTYLGNLFLVGQARIEAGGLADALAHWERVIERHPDAFALVYNNAALCARDLGEEIQAGDGEKADKLQRALALWERSYAHYEKAIELAPDDARFTNDTGLMLVYYLRRDYDRAEELFARAIELAEAEVDGLEAGTPTEVARDLDEVIGDAWENRGVMRQQMGRPAAEIRPCFANAIEHYPFGERRAANLLRDLGRQSSLRQDPQDPRRKRFDAAAEKAAKKAESEDFDGALLILDEIAKEMKGFAPYHHRVGVYSLEYGRAMLAAGNQDVAGGLFADAVAELGRAVTADPKDASTRVSLAEACLATGDFQRGLEAVAELESERIPDPTAMLSARARSAARVYVAAKSGGGTADPETLEVARRGFRELSQKRALTADERTLWIHSERWAGNSKAAVQVLLDALAHESNAGDGQQPLLEELVNLAGQLDECETAAKALSTRKDALGLWYSGRAHYDLGRWHWRGSEADKAIGALDEAFDAFDASKRKNADYTQSSNQWMAFCRGCRGLVEAGANRFEDARASLIDSVKRHPAGLTTELGGGTAKYGLMVVADSYFRGNDLGKTADFYIELGKLAPADVDFANNAGLFCRDHGVALDRSGKGNDAKKYFEASYEAYTRANQADPTHVRLRNDRALLLIYHLKRDLDTARELLESAISDGKRQLAESPPEDATDKRNLEEAVGDAYENLGVYWRDFGKDNSKAKDAFETSLEYYPGRRRASTRHLQRLQGSGR